MATPIVNLKPMHHPDEKILDDIWSALWKEETIRMIDIHDITVKVDNRRVCLSGHLFKDFNNHHIEEIIGSIPGVIAVHNHLVTDHNLSIQVAQALEGDKRTHFYNIPVTSYHGWVRLWGLVPNRDIQHVVEEISAMIPTVRGVIQLPKVESNYEIPLRKAIQPRIGPRVVCGNKAKGSIYQVVIDPHNRLVTHAIVRIIYNIDGWQESRDYLVPVESLDVLEGRAIFLNHGKPIIQQYPVFNPESYPFAPLTWQPPYPYAVGSVRWPGQEKAKT